MARNKGYFYQIRDYQAENDEVIFWSNVVEKKDKKHFLDLKKKSLKKGRYIGSLFLDKLIRNIAYYVKENGFDIITTPPSSGEGINWAGMIAKRISVLSGVDYVTVFENHKGGRRFCVKQKLEKMDCIKKVNIEKMKVLIFDDFAFTRNTIANSIRILKKDNEVEGVVLCA